MPGRDRDRILGNLEDRRGLAGPADDLGPTNEGDAAPEVDLGTGQRVRIGPMIERPNSSE